MSGLTKSFTETTGLFDFDLEVPSGSVTALLGPNGAGKTTAVRVLATLLKPDRGRVLVGGYDAIRQAHEVQALIGLTGQAASIDAKLTGADNLALFGRLHRLSWRTIRERSEQLLEQFDLVGAANTTVQSYSGGMRRKLDLAVSLIGQPSILFLDEPTTGLDPASRQAMWGMIRELVAGGTSVLLTTQYLEEADALADHVTFIDAGRRIADGTPEELKARVGQAQLRLRFHSPVDAAAAATSLQEFSGIARGLVVHLPLPDGRDAGLRALKAAVDSLDRVGVVPDRFEVQDPTLDDVYFQLTGRSRPAAEAVTENTQKEKKR